MTESKPETVYLYQFAPAKTVRNVSPFCMKIEAFLRIHKIPYENRFITMKRSKYGLVPFIELNGQEIADSQIIQERLKEHFKIPNLPDPKDEAIARFVERMMDQHTFHVIYKYKLYDNPRKLVDTVADNMHLPGPVDTILRPIMSWRLKGKATTRIGTTLGMFSDDEFKLLLHKDLDALRDQLGQKTFFFGDNPTTPDCTIFGHLAGVYYLPYSTYVKEVLDEKYPSLVHFMERFKQEVFPDDFLPKVEEEEAK